MPAAATVHAYACIDLNYNLGYGMTDAYDNGPIIRLQSYLNGVGYLSALPNGHFGPSTEAAVKVFQVVNGINPIGYVGPLTRAKIKTKTCGLVKEDSVSSQPMGSIVQTSTDAKVLVNSSSKDDQLISNPETGQSLTIGSDIDILWTKNIDYSYNIFLEHEGGYSAGFIAINQYNKDKYSWHVGTVYSSAQNDYLSVATGTYRIRLQAVKKGSLQADIVSGYFTITAPKINITSVYPLSIPNDGKTAGVIFGNGFDVNTSINIDRKYGWPAPVLFRSTDNKIIVFSIPTSISPGNHYLYLRNSYDMVSDPIMITISQRSQ